MTRADELARVRAHAGDPALPDIRFAAHATGGVTRKLRYAGAALFAAVLLAVFVIGLLALFGVVEA